jgi:hypothetical protein
MLMHHTVLFCGHNKRKRPDYVVNDAINDKHINDKHINDKHINDKNIDDKNNRHLERNHNNQDDATNIFHEHNTNTIGDIDIYEYNSCNRDKLC